MDERRYQRAICLGKASRNVVQSAEHHIMVSSFFFVSLQMSRS
ncbi:hypothetical protein E5Q_00940 [Mixia osmundae IAM 14324]|uniref:Uncharacterized protein n=1 Tax=Mixia osmundae (strain CBS 9802 / IAM 14324 / JCM 22182 / KY 12970) TaxID=764103 RepID=G7DUN1_MIXOS|nr:hypothetical protein E5Q_00940 [Mixia osmundae IAM 14324]